MQDEKKDGYNGWTNYATWRVKLELFDDTGMFEGTSFPTISDLMDYLKDSAIDAVDATCAEGLAYDYACAFLEEVNWSEIARSLADDNPKLIKEPKND